MKCLMAFTMVLLSALPCLAQDNSFPSKEEIGELVQKANQKVTVFEQAVQDAKPFLSEDRLQIEVRGAATAHKLIEAIDKSGTSAYGLVVLLVTLDDLVINGSASSQDILRDGLKVALAGKAINVNGLASITALNNADTALTDISELIGHATLRMINAEEKALAQSAK